MDHLVSDPRGYWAHAGEAELVARLAIRAERERWQSVLAKFLSPYTLNLVIQNVMDAAYHRRLDQQPVKESL
jgi:hypothetical protein